MLKTIRSTFGLTALLALATVGACRQIDNPGKTIPGSPGVEATRSVELQRSQLDDVPVPRDMALITRANQSFSYSASGLRVGRFRFRGPLAVEDIVTFYRENMPISAYGWTPSGEVVEGDETGLTFVKAGDRCIIKVKREYGAATLLVMVNCEPLKES